MRFKSIRAMLGGARLMTLTVEGVTTQPLSLHEELIVMLLNQETDYFHQVPG